MKIEEAANYLKEELARWERDCKSHHPMKDALALAIQMLETGEVYMTGDDYNLFIKGYKDGMKDYKILVEESDPADSENKVRLIDADELKKAIEPLANNHTVVSCAYRNMLDIIDNAPTVEPHYLSDLPDETIKSLQTVAIDVSDGFVVFERKRPQGEWIKDNSGDRFCSVCGKSALYHEIGLMIESRFCPNCGADMQGDKE